MPFDPRQDVPPDGAWITGYSGSNGNGRVVIRYYADRGWWRVERGPLSRVGSIARTFSQEGIRMAEIWVRQGKRIGQGQPQ
jgi:hypothetical protein